MHLTKNQIDGATYTGTNNKRCVLWDDDPVGLGLRVYPSGRKAFVISYRNANGVKRQPTIGDFGVLTLDEARRKARRLLVTVDDKTDPLAERNKQRLEAKTGSVEAMFKAYIDARTKDKVRPMKRPDLPLWLAVNLIFPKFGSRPWRDVRRSEVREWHAGVEHAFNADRALQALRAAFYWRLWQEDDAPGNRRRESDTRNPCAGIDMRKPGSSAKREVRLELEELPALQKAIDAETDDPYLRAYFRFVLSTGCRKSEALVLRWTDVNLLDKDSDGSSSVTFRDTKNNTSHQIPLSDYTANLLRELTRIDGNPYVFVGRVHGERLKSPGKAWERIRTAAGRENLRIHDLRRTFGSWLGDAGFTSKQIGATLNHKSDITSRVYMALGDRSKKAAVDAVDKMMTGKKAKVRNLRSRRADRSNTR